MSFLRLVIAGAPMKGMWGGVNFSNQGQTILLLEWGIISLIMVTFFFLSLTSASFPLSCFIMFLHPSLLYSMIKPTRGISPFQNIFFSMNPTFLKTATSGLPHFPRIFFWLITKSQLDHGIFLSILGHRRVFFFWEWNFINDIFISNSVL